MSLLVDTNVLLRIAQVASPDHATAKQAILQLAQADVGLCIVPQVIYEFWVVATRPETVNGLGMDAKSALVSIQGIIATYQLLKDERGIFGQWQKLVADHEIMGKRAHDARLVAAMLRHGITRLLTINKADFSRFSAIQAFSPIEILAGSLQT